MYDNLVLAKGYLTDNIYIGTLNKTKDEYITHLCNIFDEIKRALRDDGTCWVNLGDTYAGGVAGQGGNTGRHVEIETNKYAKSTRFKNGIQKTGVPNKSLCCIPDRFKIEMINHGWICRNEIIWYKPNAMPSSIKDRFTVDYEKLFFFTKNNKYYFEQQIEEYQSTPQKSVNKNKQNCNQGYMTDRFSDGYRDYYSQGGRNKRCVWSINTKPYKDAHFAVYPPELIKTPIKAGCPEGGVVLDPFMGSGTTGLVAKQLNRNYIGIDLNPEYIEIANKRIAMS